MIRNFVIISHVDHGKSTLADRFLELTDTVDKRKMKVQYLDQLELERERGITIKMAPVRMLWHADVLNLIDTPGHSDFSYEVSRALKAVEGAILLVDVTQGIQAQTLANLQLAQEAGLTVIGVVNKIDLLESGDKTRLEQIVKELANLIDDKPENIYKVSAKTGEGAEELLNAVISRIPAPFQDNNLTQGAMLIFDSFYDDHKGVVASVRVFGPAENGFKIGDEIYLSATQYQTKIKEVGYFSPELKTASVLKTGEIGYLAIGIKDPQKVKIGDTITRSGVKIKLLEGYKEPKPVVFVSFYPEETDDHELLKRALQKLRLNDSSLVVEPDQSEVLGRGFKVGFLGRLHFEITAERLKGEFGIKVVSSFPSVVYKIKTRGNFQPIIRPDELPENYEEIWEPMINLEIIIPNDYLSRIFPLQKKFRLEDIQTTTFGDRIRVSAQMPLAELISDFDDQLKSVTEGFASFSYTLGEYRRADLVKVDLLVAGNIVPGLSRLLPRQDYQREARRLVKSLKEVLPRQQFTQSIQAGAEGRIIAREDVRALRKDVTGHLYGGDRSRKMKLWKKQKKGKKKLKEKAVVRLSSEVFKELLKK